jgi:exopolysaccharide biosynthesis predicted pyruvyltransferase EpsI
VKNVELNTDLCFSKNISIIETITDNTAVILRDWNHDESGQQHFNTILQYLIENKKNVDLVLFAKDQYWIRKAKQYKLNCIIWDPAIYTINEFIDILASYKIFISSRFHGVIYGTLLNKPVLAIEIEPKLVIGSKLNCGEIWKGDFSLPSLYQSIKSLEDSFDYNVGKILKIKTEKHAQAINMLKLLK